MLKYITCVISKRIHTGKTVLLSVDQVDLSLRKLMPLGGTCNDLPGGVVDGDKSRVGSLHPVDRCSTESHDQTQHS